MSDSQDLEYEAKCFVSKSHTLPKDETFKDELSKSLIKSLQEKSNESKTLVQVHKERLVLRKTGKLFNKTVKSVEIKKSDLRKFYINLTNEDNYLVIAYLEAKSKKLSGIYFKTVTDLNKFTACFAKYASEASEITVKSPPALFEDEDGKESDLISGDIQENDLDKLRPFKMVPMITPSETQRDSIYDKKSLGAQSYHISTKSSLKSYDRPFVFEEVQKTPIDGIRNAYDMAQLNESIRYNRRLSSSGSIVFNYPIEDKNTPISSWKSIAPYKRTRMNLTSILKRTMDPKPKTNKGKATISTNNYFKVPCELSKFKTLEYDHFPDTLPDNVQKSLKSLSQDYDGQMQCFFEDLTFTKGKRVVWQSNIDDIIKAELMAKYPGKLLLLKNDKEEKKSQYVILATNNADDLNSIVEWYETQRGPINTVSESDISITETPYITTGKRLEKDLEYDVESIQEYIAPTQDEEESLDLAPTPTAIIPNERITLVPKGRYLSTQYLNDDLWEVDEAFVNYDGKPDGPVHLWVGHRKYIQK